MGQDSCRASERCPHDRRRLPLSCLWGAAAATMLTKSEKKGSTILAKLGKRAGVSLFGVALSDRPLKPLAAPFRALCICTSLRRAVPRCFPLPPSVCLSTKTRAGQSLVHVLSCCAGVGYVAQGLLIHLQFERFFSSLSRGIVMPNTQCNFFSSGWTPVRVLLVAVLVVLALSLPACEGCRGCRPSQGNFAFS